MTCPNCGHDAKARLPDGTTTCWACYMAGFWARRRAAVELTEREKRQSAAALAAHDARKRQCACLPGRPCLLHWRLRRKET